MTPELQKGKALAEQFECPGLQKGARWFEEQWHCSESFAVRAIGGCSDTLFLGKEAESAGNDARRSAPALLQHNEQFLAFSIGSDAVQLANFWPQSIEDHSDIRHRRELDQECRGGFEQFFLKGQHIGTAVLYQENFLACAASSCGVNIDDVGLEIIAQESLDAAWDDFAVAENDIVVVSVFVNPTQFNDKKDLEVYPRNLKADSELLESAGVTALFAPTPDTFYSPEEMNNTFQFDFNGLDAVMEGKFRPGHFNGVVQVVSKLFTIINPDNAYFGEKDFQQLAIIRYMVKKMGFNINIVGCPIVREESGLALSSRNALLSEDQKKLASNIYAVLKESTTFFHMTTVAELKEAAIKAIERHDGLKVEYFEIVDANTLLPVTKWEDSDYIVGCITVFCGKVRLIDNIRYK